MRIIETSFFARKIKTLLSDEEYRKFQNELIINPTKGAVIKGSGGLRKIRWKTSDRGKRSGVRIIYYYVKESCIILLLLIYGKNEQEKLTVTQLKELKLLVEEEFK